MKFFTLLLMVISCLAWGQPANAETQKILVKVKSCDDIKVKTIRGSECVEDDFITGKCKDDDECICISPDKKIKWRIVVADNKKFKLVFRDENGNKIKTPFKANCLESDSGDKTTCKMKSRSRLTRKIYDFDVKVQGCPNAHDPRIVIKGL